MRLYDLLPEYEAILREVDEDGEITPALAARLEQAAADLSVKVENYGRWYKGVVAEADMLDREIRALQGRKRALERQAEFAKQGIVVAMETMGVDSGRFGTRKCWFQKNSQPSVVIDKEEWVPAEFLRVSYAVDKEAVKEQIAKGFEVSGCHLEHGRHLRIS